MTTLIVSFIILFGYIAMYLSVLGLIACLANEIMLREDGYLPENEIEL